MGGFAAAANSMVSYVIGMRQEGYIMLLLRRILLMCVGGVMLLVFVSLAWPEGILSIYSSDQQLIQSSIPVLITVNLSAIALAIGFVLFNGVLGTGKTNISFLIEMVVLAFYLTYVYVLINFFNADVALVWTSELLYGIVLSVLSWLYLKKGNWASGKV